VETKAMSSSPYLDVKEAGAYIRIAPGTLKNWRSRGLGPPYVKVGGRTVYHRPDLDEWMLARLVVPAPRQPVAPVDAATDA
jgi:hypothetical protein